MNRQILRNAHDYLEWRVHGTTCEIVDIAVYSERRKGVARSMVKELLKQLPPDVSIVYAICRSDNHVGRNFYEGCEFRVVGRLQDFYKPHGRTGNVDAMVYGRDVG